MTYSLKIQQAIVVDELGFYKWSIVKNKPVIPTNCEGANSKISQMQSEINALSASASGIATKNITNDIFYTGEEDKVISSQGVRNALSSLLPLPGSTATVTGTIRATYNDGVLKLYRGVDGMSTSNVVPPASSSVSGGVKITSSGSSLYISTN